MATTSEQIIVPRRDNLVISHGLLTQRFTVFFEDIASQTNLSSTVIAAIQADITDLQSDVSLLQTQVSLLQTQVGTLQADVATLQADVTQLLIDVATLQSDAIALEARVSDLEDLHNIESNQVEYIDANELYRGQAVEAATLTSASTWRIRKRVIQGDGISVIDTYADGSHVFDKIWDDRLTYIYS